MKEIDEDFLQSKSSLSCSSISMIYLSEVILTNCLIEQIQQQKASSPSIDLIEYKPLNPFIDFDKRNPNRIFS